jgi:hypothetical protein
VREEELRDERQCVEVNEDGSNEQEEDGEELIRRPEEDDDSKVIP